MGCSQFFFIPDKCPLPTTATTEECSLATFNNVDDMYLHIQVQDNKRMTLYPKHGTENGTLALR